MKKGQAGTLESNDIIITVEEAPAGTGIAITLSSIVLPQFGDMIKETIAAVCRQSGVHDVYVTASDKGALEYTIEARVLTALKRAELI